MDTIQMAMNVNAKLLEVKDSITKILSGTLKLFGKSNIGVSTIFNRKDYKMDINTL